MSGRPGRLPPVEAVAAETRVAERLPEARSGPVSRARFARMTLRTAGLLGGGFGSWSPAIGLGGDSLRRDRPARGRSPRRRSATSATRSTSPTTRALPIMKARLPSDIPAVQSPGKPLRRSSSRGVSRRIAAVLGLDEVLEPRRGRPTLAGQDRPRRAVDRVGERDRRLRRTCTRWPVARLMRVRLLRP